MMRRRDQNAAESSTSMGVRDQNLVREALDSGTSAPNRLWKFVVLYAKFMKISYHFLGKNKSIGTMVGSAG